MAILPIREAYFLLFKVFIRISRIDSLGKTIEIVVQELVFFMEYASIFSFEEQFYLCIVQGIELIFFWREEQFSF